MNRDNNGNKIKNSEEFNTYLVLKNDTRDEKVITLPCRGWRIISNENGINNEIMNPFIGKMKVTVKPLSTIIIATNKHIDYSNSSNFRLMAQKNINIPLNTNFLK